MTADTHSHGPIQDCPEQWPVIESAHRFAGRIIGVRSDTVRMPDGQTVTRDVVIHPGAVGIVALDDVGRVLVIRQYRHTVNHLLWEIPAGILDVPGESPLRAAQRELYEEADHRATDWRVLVDVCNAPGALSEALRIYLARGLTEVPEGERHQRVDEEADTPVARAPLVDLVRGILAGELHNNVLASGVLALSAALAGDGLDALRPADAPWPMRP